MFNVGAVTGYLKLSTSGWSKGTRRAISSLNTLNRTMARFGALTITSLTLIEREFGKFDKAMRHATSVSDVTASQFARMSQMALDASVQWNVGAASAAQAFYYLGSAGLTATEQMQAFNDVLILARATGNSIDQTVEGFVDTVRAFNLDFADSVHITDQLTKIVISSNQQLYDLQRALSYASSTANWANNTLAETGAMLGVMANAGIKGSMAGTVLRRAMTNLASPTREMSMLMHELNLQVYDMEGRTRPFIDVMGDLNQILAGTSEEYRNLVFEVLFGRRAIAGQIKLFDYTGEQLRKYSDEIQNAYGVNLGVAQKQMKAFTEQLGRLWRQIQRLSIFIGEVLAPEIERLANKFRDHISTLEDWIKENKDAIKEALKWTAVVGAAMLGIPILIKLTASLVSLVNPFTILIGALYMYRAVWKKMFEKGGELNIALDEFGDVLKTWVNEKLGDFGRATLFIMSLLGRIPQGWYEIFKLNKSLVDKMFTKMGLDIEVPAVSGGDIITKGKGLGKELFKTTINQLKADLDTISSLMKQNLPDNLKGVLANMQELVKSFMNNVVEIHVKVEEETAKLAEAATNNTKEGVKQLATMAKGWASALETMFKPGYGEMERWHHKFLNLFGDLRSEWSNTMNHYITEGGKMKNFLNDMFRGILYSFNRLITELAAQDLLAAITGMRPKENMPSLFFGPTSMIRTLGGALGGLLNQSTAQGESFVPLGAGKIVPQIAINIENSGTPVNLRETSRQFVGKQLVINAVVEEMNTNPGFRGMFRS